MTPGLASKYPREYRAFYGMRTRTTNPNDPTFHRYGAKGITLHDSWMDKDGFKNFLDALGPMPDYEKINGRSKWSIDRIDNNKGYSPENCRWATDSMQKRNRSDNRWVIIDGEKMCMKDACEKYNISHTTVYQRLKTGMDVIDAIKTPVGRRAYVA